MFLISSTTILWNISHSKKNPSSSSSCMALQLSIEFWPSQPTFLSILFYLVWVFQFGTLSFCISFLISSIQRVFGLPVGLLEMGYQQYIAFTILVPCILSTWPSQLSLCARIKFIIFLCFFYFIQFLISFYSPYAFFVDWAKYLSSGAFYQHDNTLRVTEDSKIFLRNLTTINCSNYLEYFLQFHS